ncbi:MAG TPA: dTDP-4-dehydrorhamnose 3,5-epimerase [Pyrinomonadaceae bacterium]|jgi:dTDP-4-dehydrorhamnose 3,5-epimerase|nr:dTDP-4-dehydrorhamnose 3,5-epimerase [Pyrinomonadaceae bacterium]
MNLTETKIGGVYVIEPRRFEDERGFLANAFSSREFERVGIAARFVETIISFSIRRGTLRGLHFQAAPHGQAKLVRCTRGRVFDVAVDIRPDSPTHRQWVGVELTEENRRMLYIPGDCAHAYLTLGENCEVFYMVSSPYAPGSGRGFRWDDPAFGIDWPAEAGDPILIERDRTYPDYTL